MRSDWAAVSGSCCFKWSPALSPLVIGTEECRLVGGTDAAGGEDGAGAGEDGEVPVPTMGPLPWTSDCCNWAWVEVGAAGLLADLFFNKPDAAKKLLKTKNGYFDYICFPCF